jgi:hypothetical protein
MASLEVIHHHSENNPYKSLENYASFSALTFGERNRFSM